MKVLHVSGARTWGGNEQQMMYLLKELPQYGVDQVLFCFENTPLHLEAKNLPVKIVAVPKTKPYSAAYRKHLRAIVSKEQVDIIHLHTSDSVTGFVVTDLVGKLRTHTVFAKKGVREKNSILSRYKYNYHNIDRIICISEYVKKHFGKILNEKNRTKMVTVYNGIKIQETEIGSPVDLRKKFNISSKKFLFGNLANHTKAKDLMTLIKAVDFLKRKGITNFHLVQLGNFSKLTPELQQEVENLDLQSYISFGGFFPGGAALMPQLDALVISSSREGGPSSLMEAFSRKTSVIATKVGVVEEVIEDGINGLSVDPGRPEALAEKMEYMLRHPHLKKEFSERSYEKFLENFTATHLGANTYKVYEELMAGKK